MAYHRVRECHWRTRELLNAALFGLTEDARPVEEALAKLKQVKGLPGRAPKGYSPHMEAKVLPNQWVELNMDTRSAHHLRYFVSRGAKMHKALRFHFYSVLAVYAWGTYETYLSMLFEELYSRRPELLISNDMITYRDVVQRRENLIGYLIEQQLDRIGRFKFNETIKYLNDRINFSMPDTAQRRLREFYSIRNIIAHRTGMLRPSQLKTLPKGASVAGTELRITKGFLTHMLDEIDRVVTAIEKHVKRKFYRKNAAGTNEKVLSTSTPNQPV